jgi:HK97 family phage portal protein
LARKHFLGSRLVAMTQMDPTRTGVLRDPKTGALKYRYTEWDGTIVELDRREVFQLKGFGFGGDRGMSIIQFGAQTIGSSLAADKVAAKMFRSGLSSSGFLETAQVLNETDRPRLEQIMAEYQGSDNAGKLMILEGGMRYTQVSMSAADAQLLQARGFNIEEIARWLGLPPILLGHSGAGSTMWGTGVEQIIQAWYTLGLRALLHRIETAINKRVIAPEDQNRYFVKFNVEGLLRGDSAARANLYSVFVQNGIMTRAEVRELEDLEPYTDGGADKLTAQINLTTLDKIGAENPAGSADAGELFKEKIKNWLGLDGGVTSQDLHDIRAQIAVLKARRIEGEVLENTSPPQLPAPKPAPAKDLRQA